MSNGNYCIIGLQGCVVTLPTTCWSLSTSRLAVIQKQSILKTRSRTPKTPLTYLWDYAYPRLRTPPVASE